MKKKVESTWRYCLSPVIKRYAKARGGKTEPSESSSMMGTREADNASLVVLEKVAGVSGRKNSEKKNR